MTNPNNLSPWLENTFLGRTLVCLQLSRVLCHSRRQKACGDTLKSLNFSFFCLCRLLGVWPLVRTAAVALNWLLDVVDEFLVTSTGVLHSIKMHADPSFQQVGARDSSSLRDTHYARMN